MRQDMFILRKTWNQIFPEFTLLELDMKVKKVDSGWPITADAEQAKLDLLKLQQQSLELKLATLRTDLGQQLEDKGTNLEKPTALFSFPSQEPVSKKRKIDWIENLEKKLFTLPDEKGKELFPLPTLASFPSHDTTVQEQHTEPYDEEAALFTLPVRKESDLFIFQDEKESTLSTDNKHESSNNVDDSDDDDVIEVIAKNSKALPNKITSPSIVTSSTNVMDLDGDCINHSTIGVNTLFENAAKIKVEPTYEEDGSSDDYFEEIGEMLDNGEFIFYRSLVDDF